MRVGFLLLLAGCNIFSPSDKPDPHDPWLPHKPASWRTTPKGHVRDAGPFQSIAQGLATEAEVDQAIDQEFDYFRSKLPQYAAIEVKVWLNDDYVMWCPSPPTWCAGLEPGLGAYLVVCCIWSRRVSSEDPGPCYIKRAPGTYFGQEVTTWRSTVRPFVPALAHEMLHVAIGDPTHSRPEWTTLGR